MGATQHREGWFEFAEDAERGTMDVIFFQETFRRDRLRSIRRHRWMRLMLEDALFQTSVALGLRVEQIQLGPPTTDWVEEMYEAYHRIAQAMGAKEASRFHDGFLRLQRRLGADETTEIPFFGGRGLSLHLQPLLEEIGMRLRKQRAQSGYRARVLRRERIQLALALVEAQVVRDAAEGRLDEKKFCDFIAARDMHQGLRFLMPKRILARLDKTIRETYLAHGMEPVSLVVHRRGSPMLSPDGVAVFEEFLFAALRRPQMLSFATDGAQQAA